MNDRAAWMIYPFLALAAAAVPIALDASRLPIVQSSYAESFRIFEVFGFSATAALAVVVWRELAKRRGSGLMGAIPVVVFTVVAMSFVMLVCEYTQKLPDYLCFENAAKLIKQGRSPYYASGYLYPPLVADALALVHQAVLGAARAIGARPGESYGWHITFYLWQCSQFFLAVIAYLLSVRFVRTLGAGGLGGLLLVAAVFLFNGPLVRTFRFDQPNLWGLDAILFALVFGVRRAAAAGALLGFAANVKMYPLVMLLPAALTRRWRMLAGFIAAAGAVVLLEMWLSPYPRAWDRYLHFARVFPRGDAFRDNGLYSVVSNTVWLGGTALGLSGRIASIVSAVLWRAALAAAGMWIALRIVRREQSFAAVTKQEGSQETAAMLRFVGHAMDAIAFALMAAPRVWEHHYVLAIPIVFWAIVTQHARRPRLIWAGSTLMLLPPSFDIYPFGYHRIAGLLMVLAGTSPRIDLAEYEQSLEAWRKTSIWANQNT